MRISILAAVFVAALSSAATAQADEPFASGLYVAGGYEAWWPTYAQIYDSGVPGMLNGFDADVGWRFNPYYAIEGGYYHASGSSDLNVTFQGAELDAFGFLPFGADSRVTFETEGVAHLCRLLWYPINVQYGQRPVPNTSREKFTRAFELIVDGLIEAKSRRLSGAGPSNFLHMGPKKPVNDEVRDASHDKRRSESHPGGSRSKRRALKRPQDRRRSSPA